MSTGIQEVCYWDNTEAKAEKKAKEFQNFQYTSASIESFNQISKQIEKIKGDIQNIKSNYNTFKTKFDEFTGFNDEMDKNASSLESHFETTKKYFDKCIGSAVTALTEQVKKDQSFQSDLDKLNSIMSGGSLSENQEADAAFSH